jgi:hypothetical protein
MSVATRFKEGNTFGGRKKGMAEYRSILTRAAYDKDPEKCLSVILKIIEDAHNGDPVCRKIFSQTYMTKSPTEIHMTTSSDENTLSHEKIQSLISFFTQKGLSEKEAAERILEFQEGAKFLKELSSSEEYQE